MSVASIGLTTLCMRVSGHKLSKVHFKVPRKVA